MCSDRRCGCFQNSCGRAERCSPGLGVARRNLGGAPLPPAEGAHRKVGDLFGPPAPHSTRLHSLPDVL